MRKLSLVMLVLFLSGAAMAESGIGLSSKPLEVEEGKFKAGLKKHFKEDFTAKDDDPELMEGDTTELSAGEKIELWKAKVPFDFGMSVDVYSQANFAGKQTNAIVNESFSNVANSFELGMINMMIGGDFGKIGFMADVAFGPRANAANGINIGSIASIKQLFITYSPAEFVKITFGNFSTFYGWELIEPQNNFHYSTSLAFQNGPFYHTGIKANFTTGNWNFMVGAFNDTDTKTDSDRNKFVGGQVGYSGENFSTYLNYVGGNTGPVFDEIVEDSMLFSKKYKSSFGVTSVASLGKNKGGSMVLDVAYHRFRLKDAMTEDISNTDYFIAYLYGQAPVKENGSIGARVGYATNKDFIIGGAKHFTDFTLTFNQKIAGLLTLVPEFKVDYANEKVFINNKGEASNTQFRLLLAAIFAI
jgi:hypothetical protein